MATLIRLSAVLVAAAAILLFLFLKIEKPNLADNGFIRHFFKETPILIGETQLEHASRSILEIGRDRLYLSSREPYEVIVCDTSLATVAKLPLTTLKDTLFRSGYTSGYKAAIHGAHYCLLTKNERNIFVYNLHRNELQAVLTAEAPFTDGIALSPYTHILRQYSVADRNLVFSKIHPDGRIEWEQDLSLPSMDLGLNTDGLLLHETGTDLVAYIHYYNNQIITFDTLLNKVLQFQTIDTVGHRARMDRNAPRLMSNATATINNGLIFICSNLRADNERYADYIRHIPVDIYHVRSGEYIGSFYLPSIDGKLIKSMRIKGNRLYTLYSDSRLTSFLLPDFQS